MGTESSMEIEPNFALVDDGSPMITNLEPGEENMRLKRYNFETGTETENSCNVKDDIKSLALPEYGGKPALAASRPG